MACGTRYDIPLIALPFLSEKIILMRMLFTFGGIMDWFHKLFGFAESVSAVRENIVVDGEWMSSNVNGARFRSGVLEIPSLKMLREQTSDILHQKHSRTTLREVVANVQDLHRNPQNRHAIFQVASQCNLLEMVGPSVTPEAGVTGYYWDRTQGPACAIAAGAGTVYRNYFVELGTQIGQTMEFQVDTMLDLQDAFGGERWEMRNGYLLATSDGLRHVTKVVNSVNRSELMECVRIGVHKNVQVTLDPVDSVSSDYSNSEHIVNQLYCSAMPVAYSGLGSSQWEALGCLVLDAAYEMTVLSAVENAEANGQRTVFLTLLGGGAFGNPTSWITSAILRALKVVEFAGLDVVVVSYGHSQSSVQKTIQEWNAQ